MGKDSERNGSKYYMNFNYYFSSWMQF